MNKYRILDMEFINNYIRKNFPNGNLTGVEIGSLAGDSAEALVLSGNFNKFYCVDPWKNGYDPKDSNNNQAAASESKFDLMAANYPQILKIKKTSMEALNDFEDASIDFVYIDAIHTYEGVCADIIGWSKKVKPGGILSGHDYDQGWPGVMKAVQELIPSIWGNRNSWYYLNYKGLKNISVNPS